MRTKKHVLVLKLVLKNVYVYGFRPGPFAYGNSEAI